MCDLEGLWSGDSPNCSSEFNMHDISYSTALYTHAWILVSRAIRTLTCRSRWGDGRRNFDVLRDYMGI